jgi:hypothetical protein
MDFLSAAVGVAVALYQPYLWFTMVVPKHRQIQSSGSIDFLGRGPSTLIMQPY